MMGSGQADLIEQSDWPRLVGSMGWRGWRYSEVNSPGLCCLTRRVRLSRLHSADRTVDAAFSLLPWPCRT